MKIETTKQPTFTPITISLTFETNDEFEAFMDLCASPDSATRCAINLTDSNRPIASSILSDIYNKLSTI